MCDADGSASTSSPRMTATAPTPSRRSAKPSCACPRSSRITSPYALVSPASQIGATVRFPSHMSLPLSEAYSSQLLSGLESIRKSRNRINILYPLSFPLTQLRRRHPGRRLPLHGTQGEDDGNRVDLPGHRLEHDADICGSERGVPSAGEGGDGGNGWHLSLRQQHGSLRGGLQGWGEEET